MKEVAGNGDFTMSVLRVGRRRGPPPPSTAPDRGPFGHLFRHGQRSGEGQDHQSGVPTENNGSGTFWGEMSLKPACHPRTGGATHFR